MDKGPDAFRTISEVADDLDLPQHVLRFWEGRFPQVKPLKRGGGRRYYRPDDVDLLRGIRHLLYSEGYTIRGVQRILKEQGVRSVMASWQDGAPPPPAGHDDVGDEELGYDDNFGFDDGFAGAPSGGGVADDGDDSDDGVDSASVIAQRFAPQLAEPVASRPSPRHAEHEHPPRPPQHRAERSFSERLPAGVMSDDVLPPAEEGRSAIGALIDRLRPGHGHGHAGRPDGAEPAGSLRLSRDDVRHLQGTLFELLECKRLLDQAR